MRRGVEAAARAVEVGAARPRRGDDRQPVRDPHDDGAAGAGAEALPVRGRGRDDARRRRQAAQVGDADVDVEPEHAAGRARQRAGVLPCALAGLRPQLRRHARDRARAAVRGMAADPARHPHEVGVDAAPRHALQRPRVRVDAGAGAASADRLAPCAHVLHGRARRARVGRHLDVEAERDAAAVAEAARDRERLGAVMLALGGGQRAAVLLADVREHEAVDAVLRVLAHQLGRPAGAARLRSADVDVPPAAADRVEHLLRLRRRRRGGAVEPLERAHRQLHASAGSSSSSSDWSSWSSGSSAASASDVSDPSAEASTQSPASATGAPRGRERDLALQLGLPRLVLLPAVQPLRRRGERDQGAGDEDRLKVVFVDVGAGNVLREPGGGCARQRREHERREHGDDAVRIHGSPSQSAWIIRPYTSLQSNEICLFGRTSPRRPSAPRARRPTRPVCPFRDLIGRVRGPPRQPPLLVRSARTGRRQPPGGGGRRRAAQRDRRRPSDAQKAPEGRCRWEAATAALRSPRRRRARRASRCRAGICRTRRASRRRPRPSRRGP